MDSVQHSSTSASSSSSSSAAAAATASSTFRTMISTTPNPSSSISPSPSTLPLTTPITHRHSYPSSTTYTPSPSPHRDPLKTTTTQPFPPTQPCPPNPPSPSTPLKTHRHLSFPSFPSFTTPLDPPLPPLNITTTRRLNSSQWAQLSSQFERIDSLASREERVTVEEEEEELLRIEGGWLLSFPFPPKREWTPTPFEAMQDVKKEWQPLTPPTSPTPTKNEDYKSSGSFLKLTFDRSEEKEEEEDRTTHGRTKLRKIDHGRGRWPSSVQDGEIASPEGFAILEGDRKRVSELLVALEG